MSELIKQRGRRKFSRNDVEIFGYLHLLRKKRKKLDCHFIEKSIKMNQRSKIRGKSIQLLEENKEFEVRNISLTKYKTYLFLP